jgi:hypothetical protein
MDIFSTQQLDLILAIVALFQDEQDCMVSCLYRRLKRNWTWLENSVKRVMLASILLSELA